MTKLVTRLGDRMLGMLLKQEKAGACVWNYRYACGCAGRKQKLIDCAGACRVTQLGCL